MRFGIKFAKEHVNYGKKFREKFADLMSAVHLGIMDSIEHFDPERDCTLTTYAGWWIMAHLQRGTFYLNGTITENSSVSSFVRKYSKVKAEFYAEKNRMPTDYEVAEIFGWDVKRLVDIKRASTPSVSLEVRVDEDDSSLGDSIETKDSIELGVVDAKLDKEIFWQKVKQMLTSREFKIIQGRYVENKQLQEIGDAEGISRERVRQIEENVLDRLRAKQLWFKEFDSEVSKEEKAIMSAQPIVSHYEGPAYSVIVRKIIGEATGLAGKALADIASQNIKYYLRDPVVQSCMRGQTKGGKYIISNPELLKKRLKALVKISYDKPKKK